MSRKVLCVVLDQGEATQCLCDSAEEPGQMSSGSSTEYGNHYLLIFSSSYWHKQLLGADPILSKSCLDGTRLQKNCARNHRYCGLLDMKSFV